MKSCPTCQTKYDDASLSFCPNDGTPLITDAPSSFDPQATIMATPPKVTNPSGPFDQSPPPAPSWPPSPQPQPQTPSAWGDPPAGAAAPYYSGPAEQGGGGIGSKLMPAAVGGVITGILTIIPIVNYGCCLWSIIGGAVAGLMYIKNSPSQVRVGEGAALGAMSGGIGWLLYLIIGLPLNYLLFGLRSPLSGEQQAGMIVGLLIAAVVTLVIVLPFAIIGGLISVPIFEKRKQEMPSVPPPPPQQNYGGGYR